MEISDKSFKQFINSKLLFKFISESKIGEKKKKTYKKEICWGSFNLDELYTSKTLEGQFSIDLHVNFVKKTRRKGKKDK